MSTNEPTAPSGPLSSVAPAAPVSGKAVRTSVSRTIKHILLKIIDISALGFCEPIVRLCYGEEPRVQLKKIGQYVVIPSVAFLIFIGLWAFLAPKHKTKSGEVPTPTVVLSAYQSIMDFHDRENIKESSYLIVGQARETLLRDAQVKLEQATLAADQAAATVQVARIEEKAAKDAAIAPLNDRLDELKTAAKNEKVVKTEALHEQARLVTDLASRQAYLASVAAFDVWESRERDHQRDIKDSIKSVLDRPNPNTMAAVAVQTKTAERRQYLDKLTELLGDKSREMQVAALQTKLTDLESAYKIETGDDLYTTAGLMVSTQGRLAAVSESIYAKPATLPYQIKRSVLCVFVGFVLGSIIAIPIGILCGLSKIFMAAMMPFIALFKPVSPIVWLPIALIVVGGFIPDPDSHWLMRWLWDLPWLGEYKINPAFIASAITVALCSLWATLVNTALGVASVDKDHMNVARVLRLGFWQRLFKIVLPSALPLVFAGLRISLGVGWMVLIAAELLSSSEGIGKFVWDQFNNGASDSFAKMMVVVFVVGVIGLILDRIMIIFQRMVSFEGSVAAM